MNRSAQLGKFLKIVDDDDDDDVDDEKNVWIVKPVEGADGAGITILSSTTEVVEHIRNNPNQFVVVSKYLTNPILFQSKVSERSGGGGGGKNEHASQ